MYAHNYRKGMISMHSAWRLRFGALALAVLAILGITLFKLNYDLKRGAEALRTARIEREAMLQRTQTLREQLDYMQTDEYVMRTARSDLGLILPDEIRYVTN